jgi:hypothetical protein
MAFLSTYSLSDNTSVYNTNLWGGGGASVNWTTIGHYEGQHGTATSKFAAITKRHAISTEHNALTIEIDDTIKWIAADGTIVTRTIVDSQENISSEISTDSFRVFYLDSDLPSTINRCPLMAEMTAVGTPVVRLDLERHASIGEVSSTGSQLGLREPLDETRDLYYEALISGDSGSPMFFLVGTQLIYATSAVFGGGGSGPNVADRLSAVLDACRDLDAANDQTGYTPTIYPSPPAIGLHSCSGDLSLGF